MSSRLLPLRFNMTDEPAGQAVRVTCGILEGRSGIVQAAEDAAIPRSVLIELDRDGGNAWLPIDHLSTDVELNVDRFGGRPEILAQLRGFAEYDLRKARARGSILITQTVRGLVELGYERQTRRYTLTTQDGGTWSMTGSRAVIKPEIVNLYSIRDEDAGRGN